MPFKDLREFIGKLEAKGEVQRIEEEVDWELEAGAMLRRAYELNLPAPFFQKIKDYPDGYRLFSGGVSNYRRIAIALDMEPDTHPKELVEGYLKRKGKVIKPTLVKDGPCKENIHVGDDAELLEFPVPMIHEDDGGRYIGTWHLTVSKDSDSDWVNWGMYRHMVYNKNTVGIQLQSVTQHIASMYIQGYEPKNKPMDVAIVIGVDPILPLCALSDLPYRVSEVDIAGAIRGEPVELVKCETVDLAVPATAEIVIEGEMRPHERMDEGPFGEHTGYVSGAVEPTPVIHVKAITHRNNPILTFCSQGIPVTDGCLTALSAEAELLEILRARGLPVTGVSIPPETSNLLTIVAVKKLYAGVVDVIAHVAWATKRGNKMPYIIVVDEDVDPFNLPQVLHAVVTKCNPDKGVVRLEHGYISPILPFLDLHQRKSGLGSKIYFDCTWPSDRDPLDIPRRASFAEIYPSEVQKKALAKWHKYGY